MKSSFPILLGASEIESKVKELGRKISEDFGDLKEPLLVVGILKGSFIFLADLVRAMKLPLHVEFMEVSSYGSSTQSSGNITIKKEPGTNLKGRRVLLVDDIIDTGFTLQFLDKWFREKEVLDLRTCALLDKPSRREVPYRVDYLGFEIEDKFVIGYGLDYGGRYRELDSICVYVE